MMENSSNETIRVVGCPLSAAILALRLLSTRPGLRVYLDLGQLAQVEGDLFPMLTASGEPAALMAPLVTAEWPAFLYRDGAEFIRSERPLGLVDPLQCLAELEALGALDLSTAPDEAREIAIRDLDPFPEPSQILMDAGLASLGLPVVVDEMTSDHSYRQFLPLGQEMVMVRKRRQVSIERVEEFAAQQTLVG